MWPPRNHVEIGKRWVHHAFERISAELKETVVLVHWEMQDHDPAYCLRFQIAGYDAETLSFTRGTLRTCGKSGKNAVRQRVEAAIRHRLTRRARGVG